MDAVLRFWRAVPDAHFVFAGDGPQTDNLKAQIACLGVAGRVHLLGLRRDVANVLAGLDLFVLPTREEALGTAYIEAMAMGLPIVGTQVGGVPEVVGDGITACWCRQDDSLACRGDYPVRSRPGHARPWQRAAVTGWPATS